MPSWERLILLRGRLKHPGTMMVLTRGKGELEKERKREREKRMK